MSKRDYYDVLGVAKDCDGKALKSAYRKLAGRGILEPLNDLRAIVVKDAGYVRVHLCELSRFLG